jgi:uncharacterized membrane protein
MESRRNRSLAPRWLLALLVLLLLVPLSVILALAPHGGAAPGGWMGTMPGLVYDWRLLWAALIVAIMALLTWAARIHRA